jgi:hypothetical protein
MTRLRLAAAAIAAVLGTAIGLAIALPTLAGSATAPPAKACVCPGVATPTVPLAGHPRRAI